VNCLLAKEMLFFDILFPDFYHADRKIRPYAVMPINCYRALQNRDSFAPLLQYKRVENNAARGLYDVAEDARRHLKALETGKSICRAVRVNPLRHA
jgi:hypothetical protein